MIHEPRGAGSGQSTRLLSPSEKIAHGGNRTRGSLPLAPWPEERQPTELPPPPPLVVLVRDDQPDLRRCVADGVYFEVVSYTPDTKGILLVFALQPHFATLNYQRRYY